MAEGPRHAEEAAHDVLAAEAFAVPASDPALRRAPLKLPDDPSGIAAPHDVLAAEEFAMPAPSGAPSHSAVGRASSWTRLAAGGAMLLALLRLRRRRR